MVLHLLFIISSILLGSTLSKLTANYLVFQKHLNIFPNNLVGNIPLFTSELAKAKTLDFTEFLIFILFSTVTLLLLTLLFKSKKFNHPEDVLVGILYLILSFTFYISVTYAPYSGIQTIVFLLILFSLLTLFLLKIPIKVTSLLEAKNAISNGVITGLFLIILLHNLTTSIAFPLAVFAMTPIFFYLTFSKYGFLKRPEFNLLLLAILIPYKLFPLLLLGILVISFISITKNKVNSTITVLIGKIAPFLVLFIFLYNPLFYHGTFDSIEEGFWAGWLEHMLKGNKVYRDFAVYHPPLLLWGLYVFTKIFGTSLYTIRLFFHLMQIIGLFMIFTVLKRLVKSNIVKIGIFLLIVAYGSNLVRNNLEIRIASGLLPLLFVYLYKIKNNTALLFWAGLSGAVAIFISLETGIASVTALLLITCFSSSRIKLPKNIISVVSGFLIFTLPLLFIFVLTGSFNKFFEYVFYYASTFSSGFQNLAMERPVPSTLIQWSEVVVSFTTTGFLWELVKFSLVGTLFLVILKKFKSKLDPKDILAFGVIVFGLILSRSALARSDEYHIVFVWVVALILIGYVLDFIYTHTKIIPLLTLTLLIFFVGNKYTQNYLFQNGLLKFQSYSNLPGNYPSYQTPRAKISTGIDFDPKQVDNLVNFIDAHVKVTDTIFVFPQSPEIYLLADRENATSIDTPTAFFTSYYQNKIVEELKFNKPGLIVYNPKFAVGGVSVNHLNIINHYIISNYSLITSFGDNNVMELTNSAMKE